MRTSIPSAGTAIVIRQQTWRVEQARRDGDILRLDVVAAGPTARGDRVTFLSPFDQVSTAPARERPRHVKPSRAAARLAAVVARIDRVRWPLASLTARAALLPHQLEPALAMLDGARRVLIADDVGLGKTIEAGVIVAEFLRRGSDARVLILVPAGLRAQWQEELSGRFGVDARLADATAIERAGATITRDDNPWTHHAAWIASLDYLKQPHVLDALPRAPIDLVVIDEAHLACGVSDRHEAACAIAARARHVVLLTATPDSGRPRDRVALARIGAIAGSTDPLVVFRRTRQDLRWPVHRTVRLHRVSRGAAETAVLDLLTRFERAVLRAAGARHRDAAILLLSVFRKRALSTTAALALSIDRRLAYLERDATVAGWIQPSFTFDQDIENDDISEDERAGLSAEIGLDGARERVWLRRLALLTAAASPCDSKVTRLTRLLSRTSEPVVIFTEFRDSLHALRARIASRFDIAVVHGGLTPEEQAREIARFINGGARVLLATDVASQGLNLQHRSRWVVSLDLPWNPVRLAQRAGRVDRIGQPKPVHITLLVTDHPAEDALIVRLARRVLDARRALAGGDLLGGALPEEPALRAAIVAGQPLDLPRNLPPFERCLHWTRPAQRVAATLHRRRLLIRHEREGALATGRPMITRARHGCGGSIAVFSVPLIDAAACDVERHVVALRVNGPASAAAVQAARVAAEQSLRPRARRIERFRRSRLAGAIERERAIAAALLPPMADLTQTGLFDRRDQQRCERARQLAEETTQQLTRRLAADEARTTVTVGEARLEAWLEGATGRAPVTPL